MFDIGGGELILIVLVVLILFGPKKIPEIAQMFGKGMSHVRKAQSQFRSQMNSIQNEMNSVVNDQDFNIKGAPLKDKEVDNPKNDNVTGKIDNQEDNKDKDHNQDL